MKVFITQKVHKNIKEFYDYALSHHEALDEITVMHKVQRLYDSLESLGGYANIYPMARLKTEWIDNNYREYICEDFHFAYKIYVLDNEEIVIVHDAVS